MTTSELRMRAEELEAQISHATPRARLRLHPEFSRVLRRLGEQGTPIPARMRSLDAALVNEEIEDRFDNMPV